MTIQRPPAATPPTAGAAFVAGIGVLTVIAAAIPAGLAAGLAVACWATWWLQPLWIPLLGPLGVPAIGWWHFLALRLFLGTYWPTHREGLKDDLKAPYHAPSTLILNGLVWPVTTYYLVRWLLA